MRFCDEEFLDLAKLPPDLSGILQFKTQASRIRDQIQGYKTRWFLLKHNFLFYHRMNEEGKIRELLGSFLLERCRILIEAKPSIFAFSLVFQNDRERKYVFLSNTNADRQRWVSALQNASYEKLQTTFILLQQKLVRITGNNPVQRQGLRRYSQEDFMSEDDADTKDETSQKESDENSIKRHPLALVQEHRYQLEETVERGDSNT